jgi:uroporphyrinogen-III decarboxylase
MRPEDYDYLIANGFNATMDQLYWRCHPDQTPEDKARLMAEAGKRMKPHTEKWKARGLAQLLGGVSLRAFARFSYARSMTRFAMDLRRMPDKVKEAIKVSQPEIIAEMKKGVAMAGVPRVFVGGSRDSATFLSPKQFEEFCLTDLMEIVYAMTDDGIDVVFHLDNDWTAFLPYFKDCPKGRCLMQLDSSTDIFKAKEVLGDHMALMGDVPPSLLALGTPEQVYDYCKRLIEVVGEGGGFILSSGCETPFNAKPENVAAMVRAGNELTWR